MPDRLITAAALLNALLVIVTAPLAGPTAFGANVTCIVQDVWDGMVHVWHYFAGLAPEADAALAAIAAWLHSPNS